MPSLTTVADRILSFSAAADFLPPQPPTQHVDLVFSATSRNCSCSVRVAFASIPPSGTSKSRAKAPYSSLMSSTARGPCRLAPSCPGLDGLRRLVLLCLASLVATRRVVALLPLGLSVLAAFSTRAVRCRRLQTNECGSPGQCR